MSNPSRGEAGVILGVAAVIVLGAIALPAFFLFVRPHYSVWSYEMAGRAKLAQAEHEKRISIEQAKAEVESAKLRAEAIKIVGEASKQYPEYRHQEFIGAFADAMQNGAIQKMIYVPTEANIPIIEARPEPEQ